MRHAGLALLLLAGVALAQEPSVIVPQRRAFSASGATPIVLESVRARVTILEQAAETVLEVTVRNTAGAPAEAVLLLPVPDGAAIHSFAFEGAAREPTAELMRREEARKTYTDIVRSLRDPALLEFAGYALVRTSVFPVPPQGTQRVRITYHQVLPAVAGRTDYVLPRSEALDVDVPWEVLVDVKSKLGIATVYSPSHEIETERKEPRHLVVRTKESASRSPGPFRLSVLGVRDPVAASLFAYPDPKVGGGYFLLVASLPPVAVRARREVTIVIDRSGSMAGPKMDQARAAALQIVEGLGDGESFNLIDYGSQVSLFAERPVVKDRETGLRARRYLDELRPTGGTNTHDALVEALRQPHAEGLTPVVFFLTDGLPTVGQTAESSIRALVDVGNPHKRRVFTFGLGDDVNAPLLDRLAEASRAVAAYVRPGEDIEESVGRAFERFKGPVLASGRLSEASGSIAEMVPAALPDLFADDQLIVLGQYRGEAPLRLSLDGEFEGAPRSLRFTFPLDGATTRNAFVPRLWAARRIGVLVDRVRQTTADGPEARAWIEEIVRLSAEWGILSEYTAFFAREGTDLSDWDAINFRVMTELAEKAVKERCGAAAVDRAQVIWAQKGQSVLDGRNQLDRKLDRVGLAQVQQASDRALFCRGKQWVDGQIVAQRAPVTPDVIIRCGTPEFEKLVDTLVAEDRQGLLAVKGEILLRLDGKNVLVRNDW